MVVFGPAATAPFLSSVPSMFKPSNTLAMAAESPPGATVATTNGPGIGKSARLITAYNSPAPAFVSWATTSRTCFRTSTILLSGIPESFATLSDSSSMSIAFRSMRTTANACSSRKGAMVFAAPPPSPGPSARPSGDARVRVKHVPRTKAQHQSLLRGYLRIES